MANYSIIINSKFKPFSYAEMLAPVQQSTEAHQKLEEAYADLTTQADMVAAKANEQTDPKAYARYKKYSEQLQQQAERLSRYGLQPDSRGDVFAMKSRFTKDILPIAEAVEKRQKYADMQTQAQLQNPTLLIGKKAATTSLDEFLDNPNIDFSQQYSGATLMQQVATQAQALAKELTSYGPGKALDSYTNTFLKKFGFNRDQVLNAINNPNDPNSSKVLKAIVDQALISSGIPQWGDEQILQRARAYANQGLWSAIGQSDITPFENFGARENLKFGHSMALENLQHQHALARQREAQAAQAALNNPTNPSIPISPNPINVQMDPEVMEKTKEMSKYDKYFTKDRNGKITGMTEEGKKKFRETTIIHKGTGKDSAGRDIHTVGAGREVKKDVVVHSDFYNYIVGLNGGDDTVITGEKKGMFGIKLPTYGQMRDTDAVKIYQKNLTNLGLSGSSRNQYYDALSIKATQRNFDTSKSAQDDLKGAIASSVFGNENKLEEVKWNTKSNTYEGTGKYLDTDELTNEKTVIYGMERSSRGLIYKVKTKGGDEKKYFVPSSLNLSSYNNATGAYKRAEFFQRMLYNDTNVDFNFYSSAFGNQGSAEYIAAKSLYDQVNKGIPLTSQQQQQLSQLYSEALLNAEMQADNLYYISKPKDYQSTPF